MFINFFSNSANTEPYEDEFVKELKSTDDPKEELESVESRTTSVQFDTDAVTITDLGEYRMNLLEGVKHLHDCTEEALFDATQEDKANPIAMNKYVLADQATEDLILIAGINCPATGKIGLEERLRWLHQGLSVRKKITMTGVFRDQKLRAVVTPSYVPLRQSKIYSITKQMMDSMPGVTFTGGYIGHRKSEFGFESEEAAVPYLEFLKEMEYDPKEAKVSMSLSNSDTGEGAVDFRVGVEVDGVYVPFEPDAKFRMPHKGKASYELWEEKLGGIPDYLDTELKNLKEIGGQPVAYPETCYANCIKEIGAQGGNATQLAILYGVNKAVKNRYDIIHTLADGISCLINLYGLTPDNQVKFMAGLARLTSPDFAWNQVDIPILR